jgi:hypothetical protein
MEDSLIYELLLKLYYLHGTRVIMEVAANYILVAH